MRLVARVAWASFVAVTSLTTVAAPKEPWAYTAPSSCPDRERVWSLLRELAGSRAEALSRVTIEMDVDEAPSGPYSERVTVRDAHGAIETRALSSPRCDDLVEGLAFTVAVALGIEAPSPLPRPLPPQSPRSSPPPPVGFDRPRALRLAAGVGAGVTNSIAPRPEWSPNLFFELESLGSGWRPSLRLEASRVSSRIAAVGGSATLVRTIALAEACPAQLVVADSLAVRPCTGIGVGLIEGVGSAPGIASAPGQERAWSAWNVDARVSYDVFRAAFAEVALGGEVPFERQRYYFAPATPVFRVPFFAWSAGLAVGVRWP